MWLRLSLDITDVYITGNRDTITTVQVHLKGSITFLYDAVIALMN